MDFRKFLVFILSVQTFALQAGSIQEKRFFHQLDQLQRDLYQIEQHKGLEAADLDGVDASIRRLRGPAFSIEGLVKAYRKPYPELIPLYGMAKDLEDECGHHVDLIDRLAAIRAHIAAAKENGADRGRGLGGRRVRDRQNGWPQASPRHHHRSRGREIGRCRNAPGPRHGRRQRSWPQSRPGREIQLGRLAWRTQLDFVIGNL